MKIINRRVFRMPLLLPRPCTDSIPTQHRL